MKVALIANNPAIRLLPVGCDLYVHFNGAIHWDKRHVDRRNVIAVRKAWTVDRAKSWRPYPNTQDPTAEIWAVGWEEDIKAMEDAGATGANYSIYIDDVSEWYEPEGKSPTTGWVIMTLLPIIEPGVDIILVGFDLKAASYYATSKIHNCDWEIDHVAELVRNKIVRRG